MKTIEPSLYESIAYMSKAEVLADRAHLSQHLDNLLYIKSILYLDDKKNEKHVNRIQRVLEAMKNEYQKEFSGVPTSEGSISLAAQILLANKLIDSGIARLKKQDQVSEAPKATPKPKEIAADTQSLSAQLVKENPKLKETLSFLVSVIDDPRASDQTALHLYNLEKINKLIQWKGQDPKFQKMKEKILVVLANIFGCHAPRDIQAALSNTILILKRLTPYETFIATFETDIKNDLLRAQAESGQVTPLASRQAHMEQFYAEFKDERNMVKKLDLVKKVLTSSAYKYDKELNAASLKLLKGLESLGLRFDVLQSP